LTLAAAATGLFAAGPTRAGMTWTYPAPLNANAANDGTTSDYGPWLATDGQGTWVAVWNARNLGGGPYGDDMDVFFARSTDDAATWSAALPLDPAATTDDLYDSSPVVYTDGTGHWLVVWESWDQGAESDIDLWYVVSTNGVDWSPPAHFNSDWATDPTRKHDDRPAIATDPSGFWVALWYKGADYGDEHDIYTSHSTDHGQTWATLRLLHDSMSDDTRNDISVSVAYDGVSRWIATWQSDDPSGGPLDTDGDILTSISTNGLSWSIPVPLHADAATDNANDYGGVVAADAAGQWIAAWYRERAGGPDRDILFARSGDGVGWSTPQPLNTNADLDSGDDGRPRLAADGSGNWVAVWYSKENLFGAIGSDRDLLFARSCDRGAHWTDPAVLNGNAVTDLAESDWDHELFAGPEGRLLTVWRTRDTLGGVLGPDYDLLMAESDGFACGDADADGDVDVVDFGRLQVCFDDPDPLATDCDRFDFDVDNDVDANDVAEYAGRMTGP
jgi:hypothetical protein